MFWPYCFENNWYYVTGPGNLTDLQVHAGDISFLVPFWFGVTEQGTLVDRSDADTLLFARQVGLPLLAIVHNFASREYGPLIHRLLTTESLRRALVSNILMMLVSKGFAGVNIDFEFIPPEDRPYLTMFMAELYHTLKQYGLIVTISLPPELRDEPDHPFSGAFSYPDLACYSDQAYILAYDEHVAKPGPIASIGFVRQVLSYALSVIPRQKIRLGVSVYGRDWTIGAKQLPRELSFQEAINTAYCNKAVIRYDLEAQAPTYTYEVNGARHVVWFEDVRSFEAKLSVAVQEGITGIAVWRLGLEDPRIWELLRRMLLC
ncbi:glycosyl hydrolase family 18 protein [Pelotomaculum propionicicum]|uniref:Putative sporulation-specific glycosylase YdhD n=1 Tax=Pelotomaculum propionicicum TaxID=258475 RepID=A0A4Y7RVE4_9FIRM|nr:glycosyl hydrolase family 18 protein [Pelotomaculum propionicicum]TEB12955.1 putative sporulation-specific glycosylase YdhD [Pelotomaculum propionicicum]